MSLVDITDRAMLVIVKIHRCGFNRKDADATADLASSTGANPEDVAAVKKLVPKVYLDPINAAASKVNTVKYKYTLPWDDGNARVLPVEMNFKFMGEMTSAIADFDGAADTFASQWNTITANAPTRLASMFKASEYPSKEAVRRMFRVEVRRRPIPRSNDWRIDVSKDMMAALRKEVEENLRDSAKQMTFACFKRVRDVVLTMVEGLERHGVKKPGGEKMQFFTRKTVENVVELVDIMDELNITEDPELTRIVSEIRTELTIWDVDMLKDDPLLRERVASKGREILGDIDKTGDVAGFFGV